MSERELFEQRFPVPAGIYWNEISEQYDAAPGAAGFDDVEIYHGRWEAWQAARAVGGQRAEPVAWLATSKNNGWICSPTKKSAIGEAASYWWVPDSVIPLYTHPGPEGDWWVPEGWKLVPIEPTPDMRRAFHEAHELFEGGEEVDGSPDDEWRAMLDAAPQPPVEHCNAQLQENSK